jgi:hypothetical protein
LSPRVGTQKPKKVRRRRAAKPKREELRLRERSAQSGVGKPKVSELLREFMDPYLECAESDEDLERLMTIGTAAWNAGILEMEDGKLPDKLIENLESGPIEQKEFFLELLERKKKWFPEFNQIILEYNLTPSPSGHQLIVVSGRTLDR